MSLEHSSDFCGQAHLPLPLSGLSSLAISPAMDNRERRMGNTPCKKGHLTIPCCCCRPSPLSSAWWQWREAGRADKRGGDLLPRMAGDAAPAWGLMEEEGSWDLVTPASSKQGMLQVLQGLWPLQDLCRVSSLKPTLGAAHEITRATAFWEMLNIPSITLRSKTIPGQVYQAFLLLSPWGNGITICVPLWYVSTKHPVCTWHTLSTILYTAYWHMTVAAGPQRFSWFLLFFPGFHWHKRNGSLLLGMSLQKGTFLQSNLISSGWRKSSHLISAWKISVMGRPRAKLLWW